MSGILLNQYQARAAETAVYPPEHAIIYTALGLAGEAGEVANKAKKILRDDNGVATLERVVALADELGDVLWYVANLANDLGFNLSEIAEANLEKLEDRKKRGVIKGQGDKR